MALPDVEASLVETTDIDYEQPTGSDDPIVAEAVPAPAAAPAPSGPQSVEPFLKALVEIGGSDLHCKTGHRPGSASTAVSASCRRRSLTNIDTENMVGRGAS